MRVAVSPAVEAETLQSGQTVRLNEALTVVEAGDYERTGEVCGLREVLSEPTVELAGRALVVGHADEERVVWLASPLTLPPDDPAFVPLKPGDSLLVDTKAGYAYERVPKAEVEDLVLEEVPDVAYEDIGGLFRPIEQMRDAVERRPTPSCSAAELRPRWACCHGRPAAARRSSKAVANSLARSRRRADNLNEAKRPSSTSRPELLNKFVGETERHIRLIFQRPGRRPGRHPGDRLPGRLDLRTRGSACPATSRRRSCPSAERDDASRACNVIVIAPNREDMIDLAILYRRPDEDQDRAAGRRGGAGHLLQPHEDRRSTTTIWPSSRGPRRHHRDDPARGRVMYDETRRRTGS
jgi:proteasome-associated ATPase